MLREWKPSSADATSLAAFRWFANQIENFAIELYTTDQGSFHDIERVLRGTLKQLKETRRQFMVPDDENGCPDGYVLCHGVCAPSCDFEASAAQPSTARPAAARPSGKTSGPKAKGGRKR